MEPNWAAENLQTIRTLMERSAIYRRALAPTLIFCGVIGLLSGGLGVWLNCDDVLAAIGIWLAAALVSILGSFFIMRRQAIKDSEPVWSAPTRRVIAALFPPFFVGGFVSTVFAIQCFRYGMFGANSILAPLAVILFFSYGCGLHSAGQFMPRIIRSIGWQFIIAGCFLSLCLINDDILNKSFHLLMGGTFGGLHVAYGIYLYFTEKKNPAA